jgi:hypothetical protein
MEIIMKKWCRREDVFILEIQLINMTTMVCPSSVPYSIHQARETSLENHRSCRVPPPPQPDTASCRLEQ